MNKKIVYKTMPFMAALGILSSCACPESERGLPMGFRRNGITDVIVDVSMLQVPRSSSERSVISIFSTHSSHSHTATSQQQNSASKINNKNIGNHTEKVKEEKIEKEEERKIDEEMKRRREEEERRAEEEEQRRKEEEERKAKEEEQKREEERKKRRRDDTAERAAWHVWRMDMGMGW